MDLKTLNGAILPYPTLLARINNIYAYTISSIGEVACLWLLSTNLFKPHSQSTKLLLSVIIANTISVGYGIFATVSNELAGGYSFGEKGCLVDYYFVVAPSCISIATLGIAARETYHLVCKGSHWSNTKVNTWITAIWVVCCLVTGIPYITSDYSSIRLEPNYVNCNFNWSGRSSQSTMITVLILTIVGSSFSIAIYSYYHICITIREAALQKRTTEESQRQVFLKCMIMTITLVVLWCPYVFKIIYENLTGKEGGADWTSIGNLGGLTSLALNPFILCKYDKRVRNNMLRIFKNYPSQKTSNVSLETKLQSVVVKQGTKPAETSRLGLYSQQ